MLDVKTGTHTNPLTMYFLTLLITNNLYDFLTNVPFILSDAIYIFRMRMFSPLSYLKYKVLRMRSYDNRMLRLKVWKGYYPTSLITLYYCILFSSFVVPIPPRKQRDWRRRKTSIAPLVLNHICLSSSLQNLSKIYCQLHHHHSICSLSLSLTPRADLDITKDLFQMYKFKGSN